MKEIFSKTIFRFFSALFAINLFLAPAAWGQADAISISAQVDKNNVSMEDSVRLSLTIHGVQNAPKPNLPEIVDLQIRSRGTSSSTQIINGKVNTSVTYNYLLIPQKAGTLVIPPAHLELGGVTYKTEPITLTVSTPGSTRAKQESPAFIETSVSNENPYVNEQVIYTFRLLHRVETKNLDLKITYEDAHFRKEDMGDAKIFSRLINGVQYKVHELSTALYPIHAGRVEIPPAVLELDLINRSSRFSRRDPFSSFFNDPIFGSGGSSVHKVLRSEPITVNIRPLPENGKPKDFANLVGKLKITSTLGKNTLEVGDTTTLTLTVTGPGTVRELALALPNLEDAFKIYPDQPESHLNINGGTLAGEKIFKFALIPLKQGVVTLPSIAIPYFDTESEKYEIAKTLPVKLTILPANDQEKLKLTEPPISSKQNGENGIKILGEDILPIHTRLADFESGPLNRSDILLFGAGMLIPPVLFLLFTSYVGHNLRLKYDTAFVRNRKAFKIASQKLKKLSSSPVSDPRVFVQQLSEIFREYIGNKLNLQGKAITSSEVEHKLIDRDYPEEQAASTRIMLENYESLQYTPGNSTDNDHLINETRDLLNRLEKVG